MLIAIFPLLIAVIGLVMYLACKSNGDLKTIGLWTFVVGLFSPWRPWRGRR
jgi:hypothetical protein